MSKSSGLTEDGARLLLLLVIPIVGWSWMPKMLLLLLLVIIVLWDENWHL